MSHEMPQELNIFPGSPKINCIIVLIQAEDCGKVDSALVVALQAKITALSLENQQLAQILKVSCQTKQLVIPRASIVMLCQ